MRSWLVAVALAAGGTAVAADDAQRIDVAVGETVERDVGYAIGLLCDDTSLIHVDLRPKSAETNTFVVKGVKEGTTQCRVGTMLGRPTFLFEIHVGAARRKR